MTTEQRMRHSVRPGLSGLAQTRGRNAIRWDGKLETNLRYVKKVTYLGNLRIVIDTVKQVFFGERGIDGNVNEVDITDNFGDYLLEREEVSKEEYDMKQAEAEELLEREKMDNNLRFSVSMCVYGRDNAVWFKTAVDSTLNQTRIPDEFVLVVDGPVSEDLNQVILEYEKNPIFKVIRLKTNQGHGIARKIGLDNCSNELVAIMDADDICVSNRFEKQIEEFSKAYNIDIVGGMITEFIDVPDNIVGKRIVPLNDKDIKEYMKKRCPMNLVTVMFKKSSVEAVGGFVDWYCEEDYYLWTRMVLAKMTLRNVEEVLVNVRVGKEMYQRRGGMKYFKSEAKLQVYMLKKGIIRFPRYFVNVFERFIVQVLMPNKVRGFLFQKLARR